MATTTDNTDLFDEDAQQTGKRISGLKRALTRVLAIPVESEDGNIVRLVEALRAECMGFEGVTEELKFYKTRLKALRRALIDLGVQADDPDEEER